MTTKNFEEYRIDNLLDLNKPAVASDILEIITEYLKIIEPLYDQLKVFRGLIKRHQKEHQDKFIKGFSDKEKLMIPVLIQTFYKGLRFKLNKRTNDMYVKVGTKVKCLSIVSMQVEKLIEETDYSIKLILIQTFKANKAIEQVDGLLKPYQNSIDTLETIKRICQDSLLQYQASLN